MQSQIDLNKISPREGQRMVAVNRDLKLDIIENMEKYGGSFVNALAECARRADPFNLDKLTDAFWDYFVKYQPGNWGTKK